MRRTKKPAGTGGNASSRRDEIALLTARSTELLRGLAKRGNDEAPKIWRQINRLNEKKRRLIEREAAAQGRKQ